MLHVGFRGITPGSLSSVGRTVVITRAGDNARARQLFFYVVKDNVIPMIGSIPHSPNVAYYIYSVYFLI